MAEHRVTFLLFSFVTFTRLTSCRTCRCGLLDVDWVNDGLDEIYKAVTGQNVDNERLNAIEDLFSLYD